ncbi:MAG: hypothetical protein ACU85E_17830 [Gammaproteobacteria bacterium]
MQTNFLLAAAMIFSGSERRLNLLGNRPQNGCSTGAESRGFQCTIFKHCGAKNLKLGLPARYCFRVDRVANGNLLFQLRIIPR